MESEKYFLLEELGVWPKWRIRSPMTAIPMLPEEKVQKHWPVLEHSIQSCRSCILCRERKQVVIGDGSRSATWMFVGEGPGKDEDIAGLPFVGRAGRLLTEMLRAIGLTREDVYIGNAVKCRPPDNRTPLIEEIGACLPFLTAQISLVSPKVIVLLGKTAVMSVLGQNDKIALGSFRQKVHWYEAIPVIVTYHPAYLLRQPKEKRKAWEDLLFAQEILTKQL